MTKKKKTNPKPRRQSSKDRRRFNAIMLAKRIKSWKSDLDGCLRFLEEIPDVENIHGRKWAVRMIEYYSGKAWELLAKPPKGCDVVVPHYRRRFKSIEGRLKEFRD